MAGRKPKPGPERVEIVVTHAPREEKVGHVDRLKALVTEMMTIKALAAKLEWSESMTHSRLDAEKIQAWELARICEAAELDMETIFHGVTVDGS